MTLNVVHPKLTGAPADPSALIDGPAWDASHVITGTLTVGDYGLAASALTDTTNAGNITAGTLPAGRMPALTGDVTTAVGTVATTLATVNSNVGSFGSATQSAQFTVNAKGLVTAAVNVTVTPAIGNVTGLGSGIATFLATPSSANLRAAITDETGSGAAYFQGGDIGTPSAGVVTNLSGTASININGTVGATTPTTGKFTTVSPTVAPTTGWGIDFTGVAGTTVAGSGSTALAVGSGLVMLTDTTTTGQTGLYLIGGSSTGAAVLIAGGSAYVSPTVTPAANKYSVGFDGTNWKIYNGNASAITFGVGLFRARNTN